MTLWVLHFAWILRLQDTACSQVFHDVSELMLLCEHDTWESYQSLFFIRIELGDDEGPLSACRN